MLSYSYFVHENEMREYGTPAPKHTFFNKQSNKPKHTFWKECSVCFDYLKDDTFITLNPHCSHASSICTNCIKTYVRGAVSGPDVTVKCPECNLFFTPDVIGKLLNANDQEQYHYKLATNLLSKDPHFVWCAHGCGSGQIEECTGPKIQCRNCHKHTCSKHKDVWHRGYSCEAYEFYMSVHDRKTVKYLTNNCKRCPSCNWAIERISGCDHMSCSMCRNSFCWECSAVYEFDEVQHEKTCPNYSPEDDYSSDEESDEEMNE